MIRVHRISWEKAEQALVNDAIPIYEQDVESEPRFIYYGETDARRQGGDVMNKTIEIPKFKTESQEADWWASPRRPRLRKASVRRGAIKGR